MVYGPQPTGAGYECVCGYHLGVVFLERASDVVGMAFDVGEVGKTGFRPAGCSVHPFHDLQVPTQVCWQSISHLEHRAYQDAQVNGRLAGHK